MEFLWFMIILFIYLCWSLSMDKEKPDGSISDYMKYTAGIPENYCFRTGCKVSRRVVGNLYLDLYGGVLVISQMFDKNLKFIFLGSIAFMAATKVIDAYLADDRNDEIFESNREYIDKQIEDIRKLDAAVSIRKKLNSRLQKLNSRRSG